MSFVLDCSVTITWCFEDEASEYADAVHDYLIKKSAIVPAVWVYEVSNVLAVGERRGRISAERANRQISLLAGLKIAVADCDREHMLRAVRELALRHNLAAYDAAYLDLAIRTGLPLASIDKRLVGSAHSERITLFDPRSMT